MGKRYSESFKNRAIEKALTRGAGVSILQIANDIGVARTTLYDWLVKSGKTSTIITGSCQQKRPKDWLASEKLQAIIETSSLTEEKLNSYCRRNGIYKHHIEQWKVDMAGNNNNIPDKAEVKALRAENKKLRKQIQRKDKALAETAALLVLQKKVEEIWASRDEED